MNTNEETNPTGEVLEPTTMDNQQDIIGQVMDNSDELKDLNDSVEHGVGDIL
jgi:hypothetical protein